MTLHTSIVITGDTAQAKAALDQLAGANERLEAEARGLSTAEAQVAAEARLAATALARQAAAARDVAGAVEANTRVDLAAAGAIGQFTAAITAATNAERSFTVEQLRASQAAGAFLRQLGQLAHKNPGQALQDVADRSRVASHHLANLGFQLNDVIVGLVSGQRPMTVFVQQGAQIGQIMAQAQIGVGGLAREVGGLIGRFAAAHPILTGVAVAAGAAAGAISIAAHKLTSEHGAALQAYARQLKLTSDEIEEAGGAVITFGDVIGGLWDTIREGLGLDDIWGKISSAASSAAQVVFEVWKEALARVYAGAAAAIDGIRAAWQKLGPVIGEAVIAGVNAAIGALETLVNRAIDALNTIAAAVNPMLMAARMQGVQVGVGHVSFGRFDNPFSGAIGRVADTIAQSYDQHLSEARSKAFSIGSSRTRSNGRGCAPWRPISAASEIWRGGWSRGFAWCRTSYMRSPSSAWAACSFGGRFGRQRR